MGALIGFIMTVAVAWGLIWGAGAWSCWADFGDSKFDYRYKILKGCQYHSEMEGWLPEKRLRNLN